MSQKTSIQDLEKLAAERNHTLISVSNKETPSQGDLEIICNSCGERFSTSTKSYKNARKTGCPICKSIKAREQVYTKPKKSQLVSIDLTNPRESKLENAEGLARIQAETSDRLVKRAEFQRTNQVYSREELVAYLRKDPNVYNTFMLEKMEKEPALLADKSKQKQVHHIIPKHANGPNALWNCVRLTPEDHCKAHELRYGVYKEFGDYNFLQTQGLEVRARIGSNSAFDKQLLDQRRNANNNARPRFTNDSGGNASQAVLAGLTPEAQIAHRERHQNQMSTAVREVLQNGATFIHKTGVVFKLQPRQAPTLTELKDLLAAQLPVGNKDRDSLEKAKKPADVTSNLSKMIKGKRPTAFGWQLK